jgi:branched-chain amino acid transport system permease protein
VSADFPRFPNPATALTAALLVALPLVLPSTTLASEIVVLATGALSAAFLLGQVGLLSFGQGLYFGLGAYATGLLLSKAGIGFVPALLAGPIAGAVLALPVGWLIVRRRGVYFVMLTLAFAQMGFFAMHAMGHLTGGENGLSGVPRLALPALAGSPGLTLYYVLAALFFLALVIIQRVQASPFGTVLTAIRHNEDRAEVLGYDTRAYKIAALALAGAVAGLAGSMNTLFLGFVPPSAIDLELSERLLVVALIGGTGSPAGALLGAGFYAILADTIGHLWGRWLMLIAALLVIIVLVLKDGLVGVPAQIAAFNRRRAHGRPA